ncbi:hypothetical protein CONPUDRAFT_154619 [Coniophora puteana RWD-64-598 SS2]|uniref:APC amino acid permease n=1 Tax=Coniophora puteana (strain RWD-64-598) TaxID=741705 RepID=A0A5M3MNB0_CONPW|nr:uncharacterized protein CONPUDRAFT_154619 [Coniophora puteana RWD-64-598 SS2]EIW80593.1 hypothetical protein CONPUDRAFT_154619 [Coniophora puteana RWD-64-598 SS2]
MANPSIQPTANTPSAQVKVTDEALLARIGYRQELKREFRPLEMLAVCLNVMGIVPTIASVLFNSVPNGGPVAMVWGWVVVFPFILCIALSIAELASANPTSGGLYYWTHALSPPKCRNFMSWVTGYANTIGSSTGMTGIDWAFSVQVMAGASMATEGAFVATQAQTFQWMAFWICFLPKFSRSFVDPGYDSSVHMSEEASNAAMVVPWATVISVISGFVLGLAVNISLAFCMGPSTITLVDSPLGQPMAQIFSTSLGTRAGLALWSIVIVAQFSVGASFLLVMSRQVFAFARDGALPFSRFIYSIGYGRGGALGLIGEGVPVIAVWTLVVLAALTGLLSFAGEQAIKAVFAMSMVAIYVAYIGPIAARVMAAWNEAACFRPGPFHMGYWGVPINLVALAFMVFTIVVFLFPASPGTAVADMNYAVVVLSVMFALIVGWYYCPTYGGVHWFRGPQANVGTGFNVPREKGDCDDQRLEFQL